jgi:hypothetical protein
MRHIPFLLLLSLCAPLIFSGCGDDEAHSQNRAATHGARDRDDDDEEDFDRSTPPRLGMSRSQVVRLYGEPDFVSATPRGETWTYRFDTWKFAVPYYSMAAKIKTGTVTFNGSGRVADYQWGTSKSMIKMAY